ncbi:MAG: hypothetical protein AB1715_01375 [Acidobacteriota bacterium]
MSTCKIVNFFSGLIPLKLWRVFFLRVHVDGCPGCQAELASREEVQSLLARAEGMSEWPSLWPRVAGALAGEAAKNGQTPPGSQQLSRRKWQWALGIVMLFAAAVVAFWLLRGIQKSRVKPLGPLEATRFELRYVKIGGEPADAFVYQPHDSDMVIIWAGKKQSGGDE